MEVLYDKDRLVKDRLVLTAFTAEELDLLEKLHKQLGGSTNGVYIYPPDEAGVQGYMIIWISK